MTTLMEQKKHQIAERLARLGAERERLSGRLDELEIAERVPARFGGKAVTTEKRRRARPGGGRWGAERPKQSESARRFGQRRQFEGRTGA
jgi:hypothetical protein